MDPVRHAMLARELIAACGGLVEAAEVCRLKRSRLSDCQNADLAGRGRYLPIDVIAQLEAYCGRPIYSASVAAARPARADVHTLLTEACQVTEEAAALQRLCRRAEERGPLSLHERRLIEAGAVAIEQELDALRAAAAAAASAPLQPARRPS